MTMKGDSIRGLMMLKLFFLQKLQRNIFLPTSNETGLDGSKKLDDEEIKDPKMVPRDVKQGHFAVNAMKDGKPTRFVLELDCLNDPRFIELLEQAEEEYGFEQTGVLGVPCRAQELETILGNGRRRRRSAQW